MNKEAISKSLRDEVTERANHRCEYCLVPSIMAAFTLQIDHIIPEKQKGPTTLENLALACKPCNVHKGYSVVRYYYESGEAVLLFNPRQHVWAEHFDLHQSGRFIGLTRIGEATIDVLALNLQPRIEFRERMIANGIIHL